MQIKTVEKFYLIGISVRTSNQNGQAGTDIPALWQRFYSENCLASITDRIDNTIYAVYTDYEGDHTLPYTTIIGCRVKNLEQLPAGFIAKTIEANQYEVITASGKMSDGIVYNAWTNIWNSKINRNFIADFEVYGEKALDPNNASVEIYVGVKQ
jgi:predicted transcriptional regulator YdeE